MANRDFRLGPTSDRALDFYRVPPLGRGIRVGSREVGGQILRYEASASQALARSPVHVGHWPYISLREELVGSRYAEGETCDHTQVLAPLLPQPAPLLKGQLLSLKNRVTFLPTTLLTHDFACLWVLEGMALASYSLPFFFFFWLLITSEGREVPKWNSSFSHS